MHFSRAARQSIKIELRVFGGCTRRLHALTSLFRIMPNGQMLDFWSIIIVCSFGHAISSHAIHTIKIIVGYIYTWRDVTQAIRNSGSVGYTRQKQGLEMDGWMGLKEHARNQPSVKSATRLYLSLCFRASFLILDAGRPARRRYPSVHLQVKCLSKCHSST